MKSLAISMRVDLEFIKILLCFLGLEMILKREDPAKMKTTIQTRIKVMNLHLKRKVRTIV